MRSWWIVWMAGVLACGSDDVATSGGSAGAGAEGAGGMTQQGGGGSGGDMTGGGGTGVAPAPDWRGSIHAVYEFEQSADLGVSTGFAPGTHLSPVGGGAQPSDEAQQGMGSVHFIDDTTALASQSGTPFDLTQPGLTWGGWVDLEVLQNIQQVVGRTTGTEGYELVIDGLGRPQCDLAGPGGAARGEAGAGWVHLVCRTDGATDVGLFVDAALVASDTHSPLVHAGRFSIGLVNGSNQGFRGWMDEIFMHDGYLTDAQIARIYACGIDGALCSCQGAAYVSCGRSAGECDTLPPCDALLTP